jgi:pimeloyl-ACP methyl ester carboxylesterase
VRRLVAVVAVVLVVALALGVGFAALHSGSGPGTASGATGPTPVTPTSSLSPTRPPSPALARFYDQNLQWSSCGDGHQCAKLTVPLDYHRPDGQTIQLALLKVPAAGPGAKVGSLVINPGGPGEPGTSYAAQGGQAFGRPLLDHFDIVGFDPRGTGGSDPVVCLSDSQLNTYLGGDPDPSTPAQVRTFRQSQQAFAHGCAQRSGALASHISTVESARDMDILRAALGEPQLNYLGASYGTKLGATYAQLFPSRVGRFVLDGAIDPRLGTRAETLQQAAGFQRALDSYAANCVNGSAGCFLGNSVSQVDQTIRDLLDKIAQNPLPTSDGRQLTAGDAFYGIAATLYSRSYWVLLSEALQQAQGGDGSLLMQLADAYASRNPNGTFKDNSMQAFYDISCLDDPWSLPYSKIRSQYPAFDKASPVFGKVFAWSLTSCRGFTPRSDEKVPVVHARGAAPIVVIGTTRDPATPYQWAVHLAHQLASGVLLTRNGDGHTAYNTGNACINNAVESYLVSGDVPRNGTRC